MFNLGDECRDVVTGCKGIIIGVTQWISGCIRYGIQPTGLKDGKPYEETWFDEERLKMVKKGAVKITPRFTGGPQNDPRQ